MNPNAALSTASKPQVIGALKAASSTDPDVLLHVKEDLLDQYRPLKMMSLVPIVCGGLISLTVIGAIIGIPLILLGIFLRRKCKRNMIVRTISLMRSALSSASRARLLMSLETTAKPRPASPARAASTAPLTASMLVFTAIRAIPSTR